MEGILPLGGWIAVIVMAVAGAWMYFVLRPTSPWWKAIGLISPAVAGGVGISLSLCEYYTLESLHHKMISAFFAALLCMPISRAAIMVTESEAVGWIKQMALRVLGVKSPESEAVIEDTTHQGGES